MNVAGAFNNVHHDRLIHNLRKRKIPGRITGWVRSFLKDRTTRLKFNNIISQIIHISTSISQESSISSILYIYYNNDLLDISNKKKLRLNFINDINYEINESMTEENAIQLQKMLEKAEI